jgi:hypothetical protein
MSATGYLRPDMRPNNWRAETGERCELCRDAAPNAELIARIERAPSQADAGRGNGLTDAQRAALRPWARGYSYRTIGDFLAIKDMTVVSRIRDGLNNLDRLDGRTVPHVAPADDDDAADCVVDASQDPDSLADSITRYVRARGGFVDELAFDLAFPNALGSGGVIPEHWPPLEAEFSRRGIIYRDTACPGDPEFDELVSLGFTPGAYDPDEPEYFQGGWYAIGAAS